MIDTGTYTPPEHNRIREAHDIGYRHGLLGGTHKAPKWIDSDGLWRRAYTTGLNDGTRERLIAARKVAK